MLYSPTDPTHNYWEMLVLVLLLIGIQIQSVDLTYKGDIEN